MATAVVVGVPTVWCAGVFASILLAGRPNPDATGDAAIVLGAAVWDDEPSPVFQARIDHAVALFKKGQVEAIVVTGGQAEGDSLSEGEAARRYAIRQGVPSRAILVEHKSTSTWENLENAQAILVRNGMESAVIVSDPYHLKRAGVMAGRLGLRHETSPTPTTRYRSAGNKGRQLFREAYELTWTLFSR